MALRKRVSLGRGLSALIPTMEEETAKEVNTVSQLSVDEIKPNPFQPRKHFDLEILEELKQSIKEKGIIQPITVRKVPSGYELISGERRLRASQSLGLAKIPAYVISVNSNEEMLELAIIENIQRENLNAIEIAEGYERLIHDCNLTQEEVSTKVGKNRSTITNFLRLLKLPKVIQDSIIKNEITMGKAKPLISVDDTEKQLLIWQKSIQENLSAREVEVLCRQAKEDIRKSSKKPKKEKAEKSDFILKLESRIKETLLIPKVRVKPKRKGGEITIHYANENEFNQILDFFKDSD